MEHLQRCSSCPLLPFLAPPPGFRELGNLPCSHVEQPDFCSSRLGPVAAFSPVPRSLRCAHMPSPGRLLVAEALHICLAKQAARMHVSCAEVRTACTCPKCPRGQLGCFPSEAASALRLREASVAYAPYAMMMMMIKVREWYAAGLPAARYTARVCTNNIVQLNKQFTDC